MIRCKTSHKVNSDQNHFYLDRKKEFDNIKAIEAYNIRKMLRPSKTPLITQKKRFLPARPLTKMKLNSQTPQISSKNKFFQNDLVPNSSIFKNRMIQNKVPNISLFVSTFSSFNINFQKFNPIKTNSTKLSCNSPDILLSKSKFWRNNPLAFYPKQKSTTMPFYINSRLYYNPCHLGNFITLEDSKSKLLKKKLNRKKVCRIRVEDFYIEKIEKLQNKQKVHNLVSYQKKHLNNESNLVKGVSFSQYIKKLYNKTETE